MPRTFYALLLGFCFASAALAEPASREMEAALAKSLQAVGNNHLDVALDEVNALLKSHPNFKLAQLVKGDLLMAHAQQIKGFGSAANAPKDQLQDLRDEANARLQRVQQQQPVGVPQYLWKMDDAQRYAVVVDTSKATLYLFENVRGEPKYVTDFYISVGKKGTDKIVEGDKKTPLGVYFIDGHLNDAQLEDLYGNEAFTLDYPNEWDTRQGRNGKGIWLHGTPSDTYSRPPRASNGCVVLGNADLKQLGRHLQIGNTPIIIAEQMRWSDAADQAERSELLAAIEQWRKDWASRDTETYLKHYARDFAAGRTSFNEFAQQKRLVNSGKTWIKVQLAHLSVFPYPNQAGLVVVNFEQDYSSNNLSNRMHKRQYWVKREGRWKIIYEGAA